MRNFSKTLISMAAVMAVGSAMAAGAMAADLTIGQDTLKTDGKISISGVTADKSQYTLLVVQGTTAEGSTEVTYNATESTIKQIDQNDAGTAFTEAVVGTDLEDGSYKVLVGNNDGTVDSGIFTVSSTPVVQYEDIVIGDVTGDSKVTAPDYGYVLTYVKKRKQNTDSTSTTYTANTFNKRTAADGSTCVIGDVTGDGKVTAPDYGYVLTYVKKRKQNTDSTSTTYTANTFNKISVVVE